jgi:hypothetical protein
VEQAGNLSHKDKKPHDPALSFQLLLIIVLLVWTILAFPAVYHDLWEATQALLAHTE